MASDTRDDIIIKVDANFDKFDKAFKDEATQLERSTKIIQDLFSGINYINKDEIKSTNAVLEASFKNIAKKAKEAMSAALKSDDPAKGKDEVLARFDEQLRASIEQNTNLSEKQKRESIANLSKLDTEALMMNLNKSIQIGKIKAKEIADIEKKRLKDTESMEAKHAKAQAMNIDFIAKKEADARKLAERIEKDHATAKIIDAKRTEQLDKKLADEKLAIAKKNYKDIQAIARQSPTEANIDQYKKDADNYYRKVGKYSQEASKATIDKDVASIQGKDLSEQNLKKYYDTVKFQDNEYYSWKANKIKEESKLLTDDKEKQELYQKTHLAKLKKAKIAYDKDLTSSEIKARQAALKGDTGDDEELEAAKSKYTKLREVIRDHFHKRKTIEEEEIAKLVKERPSLAEEDSTEESLDYVKEHYKKKIDIIKKEEARLASIIASSGAEEKAAAKKELTKLYAIKKKERSWLVGLEIKRLKAVILKKDDIRVKANKKELADVRKQIADLEKASRRGEDALLNKRSSTQDTKATVARYKEAGTALKSYATRASMAMAAVVGLGWAIKRLTETGVEFNNTMAGVKATTSATANEFERMADQARKLGASTIFMATEVAKLELIYAKIGYSTKEILDATEATIQLATATGEGLAESAEVAGFTIRGFGMDAKETTRVVDVMAKSFTSSALNLERYKESMKLLAPMAKAVGFSLEQTSALMAKLADAGIHGSIAGTALRNTLSQIRDENSSLAKVFGGTANSWEEFVELLKLAKLQGEDFKDRALSGLDLRIKGIVVNLVEQADALDMVATSFENASGSAQTMSEIRLDTIYGDIKLMNSAFEGLKISLTEEFTPILRGFYSISTDFFSLLTKMPDGLSSIMSGLAVTIGTVSVALAIVTARAAVANLAMILFGGGVVKVTGFIGAFRLAMAGIPFLGVAALITTVVVALGTYIWKTREATKSVLELIDAQIEAEQLRKDELESQKDMIDNYIKLKTTLIKTNNQENTQLKLLKAIQKEMPGFTGGINDATDAYKKLEKASRTASLTLALTENIKRQKQYEEDSKAFEEYTKKFKNDLAKVSEAYQKQRLEESIIGGGIVASEEEKPLVEEATFKESITEAIKLKDATDKSIANAEKMLINLTNKRNKLQLEYANNLADERLRANPHTADKDIIAGSKALQEQGKAVDMLNKSMALYAGFISEAGKVNLLKKSIKNTDAVINEVNIAAAKAEEQRKKNLATEAEIRENRKIMESMTLDQQIDFRLSGNLDKQLEETLKRKLLAITEEVNIREKLLRIKGYEGGLEAFRKYIIQQLDLKKKASKVSRDLDIKDENHRLEQLEIDITANKKTQAELKAIKEMTDKDRKKKYSELADEATKSMADGKKKDAAKKAYMEKLAEAEVLQWNNVKEAELEGFKLKEEALAKAKEVALVNNKKAAEEYKKQMLKYDEESTKALIAKDNKSIMKTYGEMIKNLEPTLKTYQEIKGRLTHAIKDPTTDYQSATIDSIADSYDAKKKPTSRKRTPKDLKGKLFADIEASVKRDRKLSETAIEVELAKLDNFYDDKIALITDPSKAVRGKTLTGTDIDGETEAQLKARKARYEKIGTRIKSDGTKIKEIYIKENKELVTALYEAEFGGTDATLDQMYEFVANTYVEKALKERLLIYRKYYQKETDSVKENVLSNIEMESVAAEVRLEIERRLYKERATVQEKASAEYKATMDAFNTSLIKAEKDRVAELEAILREDANLDRTGFGAQLKDADQEVKKATDNKTEGTNEAKRLADDIAEKKKELAILGKEALDTEDMNELVRINEQLKEGVKQRNLMQAALEGNTLAQKKLNAELELAEAKRLKLIKAQAKSLLQTQLETQLEDIDTRRTDLNTLRDLGEDNGGISQAQYTEGMAKLDKERIGAYVSYYAGKAQEWLNYGGAALNAMNEMAQLDHDNEMARIDARLEKKLEALALEEEANKQKLENGSISEQEAAQVEKQLEKEKEAANKAAEKEKEKQFEKMKKWQIAEAAMSTANSIVGTWAGYAPLGLWGVPLAIAQTALLTALGVKQIASIRKQKYASGGFTGYSGGDRDETGYKIAGDVHEGEFVMTEKATKGNVGLMYALMGMLEKGANLKSLLLPSIKPVAVPRLPQMKFASGGYASKSLQTQENDAILQELRSLRKAVQVSDLNNQELNRGTTIHIDPLSPERIYEASEEGRAASYALDPMDAINSLRSDVTNIKNTFRVNSIDYERLD